MPGVLLCAIHSQYIHTSPALATLSRYAGERGVAVSGVEYNVNQPLDRILADLYRRRPDILGFSCYLWNIGAVESLTRELKQLLPGLRVFLGGPDASFRPAETLARIPADYLVAGEGERRTLLLLKALLEGREPEGIDGVFSPLGGREAPYEDPLVSLDDPAFGPDPDLVPDPHRILYYESSRGCPYRCSYCLSCLSRGVRVRSLELVKEDLLVFLRRRPPQVKLVDRTFNFDSARATAIWAHLMAHDNGVTNFHFELNGDLLTPEQIALLKNARPGLFQFELGLQSTNPRTLEAIGRSCRFSRLRDNLLALGEAGNIHLHLDLIAGLPYEDYASFGRSFDDAFSCRPHMLQLGFLKVLKGTRMEAQREELGIRVRSRPPYEVLDTRWITFSQLQDLKGIEELVDHYWNSGRYGRAMAYLLGRAGSPFGFFQGFSRFLRGASPALTPGPGRGASLRPLRRPPAARRRTPPGLPGPPGRGESVGAGAGALPGAGEPVAGGAAEASCGVRVCVGAWGGGSGGGPAAVGPLRPASAAPGAGGPGAVPRPAGGAGPGEPAGVGVFPGGEGGGGVSLS